MGGSSVVDVVIGMALVYTLLSIVCSASAELLADILSWRAKTLEQGVRSLLRDPDARGLAQLVYAHPSVQQAGERDAAGKLAHIPAAAFAAALLDSVQWLQGGAMPEDAQRMREAVQTLPEEYQPVRTMLLHALDAAGDSLEQARMRVAQWFDNAMVQATRWYTQRMRWVLFVLGFLFSVVLNLDTFALVNTLWLDSAVRAVLVSSAETVGAQTDVDEQTAQAQLALLRQEAVAYTLIGWPETLPMTHTAQTWRWWLAKLFGLVVTAGAASAGAPFWFQMLRRLTGFRRIPLQV